jgi:glycosyltransferase involved in cell wall biosynthesis
MAKTSPPRDPVTVVIPVFNAAERLEKIVPQWADTLTRFGREYEVLVVNDGSTDATTATIIEKLAGRVKHFRALKHDSRKGFGACLRTALAETTHPLFFYTSTDYPYSPSDLRKLLERIEVRDEVFGKQPDLISGCRVGQPAPLVIRALGRSWRLFWRIALGLPLQPGHSWLGWREFFYGSFVGWIFGVPLQDVNSAFKLYRTSFLKRFPIQSDSDFVHTELVAKATFLTSIMDELPLTPKPEPVPRTTCSDMWRVFVNPEFGTVQPTQPPTPDALPQAPVPDSRDVGRTDSPPSSSPLSFVPVT